MKQVPREKNVGAEASNAKDLNEAEWLADLSAQTEQLAFFAATEMIVCGKCQRKNPPTRLKCFYCAAELELADRSAENLRPALRKLEMWEKGFNLIAVPENSDSAVVTEIAKRLRLDREVLEKILASKKPLPVARAESLREAEIVVENLRGLGLATRIVSDDSLAADAAPKRLRGLEFADGELVLILFNSDESVRIRGEDLALIITGAVFERKTEAIEKRKKGESKVLDQTETSSDEPLIDVYRRQDETGYRILAKGFDFSCLAAEKRMLAAENIKLLARRLAEFAPAAKTVADYLSVREVLGYVWELEQRKDSQGLKRHSFGKFDFANVASSNNLQQFTKYSRLQRQLL